MRSKQKAKIEAVVFAQVVLVALGARCLFGENLSLTPDDDVVAIVNAATEGCSFTLAEGTYALSGTIQLAKDITVVGAGADRTVLDFQTKCRGVILSAAGALLEGVAVSNAVNSAASGGGVYMTAGTVRNCRITDCAVSGQNHGGGGVYMTDGLIEGCEIDNCVIKSALYGHGNAIWMTNGKVSNCDIHANDGGYSADTVANGGGVVCIENGTIICSKVHDNNKDSIPGIHQKGGKVINCLIYNNVGKYASAGIFKEVGGETYNCTICNCVVTGETDGRSGMFQKKGTTKNCIVWDCHPPKSTAGSVRVDGGTFANCVTEKAVSKSSNTKTGDPQFVNPAANDFHLANMSSSAYQTGVPVSGVTNDLDGRLRDAEKPCAGAYEYDSTAEAFELLLKLDQSEYPVGAVPQIEAIVTGVDETLPVSWTLDGETLATTDASIALPGLAAGRHTIAAAVDAGVGRRDAKSQEFAVRPLKVYVNNAGRGEYPFDTFEKGTNCVEAAFAALWSTVTVTSEIVVAEGVYTNAAALSLLTPVRLSGAGRDATRIVCESRFNLLTVANDAAYVHGVTVEGASCGVVLSLGEIADCRFLDCGNNTTERSGGGVNMSGGTVANCLFENCYARGLYGGGGGAYLTGGTITNCVFANCRSGTNAANDWGGGAVCVNGDAIVTHSQFIGCRGDVFPAFRNNGGTVRNVLVTATEEGVTAAAWQDRGTTESCTIVGNSVVETKEAVHVVKGAFLNNIVWDNTGAGGLLAEQDAVVGNCCYPEAEEGVSGNTAKDPQLKSGCVIRSSSPCRNAGVNRPWMVGAGDLRGNPRVLNGRVDMGCYEVPASGLVLMLW